jgi:hypothetical protein
VLRAADDAHPDESKLPEESNVGDGATGAGAEVCGAGRGGGAGAGGGGASSGGGAAGGGAAGGDAAGTGGGAVGGRDALVAGGAATRTAAACIRGPRSWRRRSGSGSTLRSSMSGGVRIAGSVVEPLAITRPGSPPDVPTVTAKAAANATTGGSQRRKASPHRLTRSDTARGSAHRAAHSGPAG